jgi:hypothetical protein
MIFLGHVSDHLMTATLETSRSTLYRSDVNIHTPSSDTGIHPCRPFQSMS